MLVPAFGEANVIADLVEHLGHLDYPRDRLEVLLLLEEVDRPTIEAAMGSGLPAFVRIVVVPDGQPRTKPKACNVGLNFAHGEFLVIYDAEDRPAPDQLRKAVAAFRAAPPEMICLQARLSYWNVDENALTRFFTLEYAHWFDLMLDGLAALHLPIPLGGTSNHFRVEPLRARRRLGSAQRDRGRRPRPARRRAGHDGRRRSTSTTLEEACCRPWPWIKQRTRWIKGYMQTALVHTRHPVRFVRMAGLHGTLTLVFLVAGTPLAFLAAPVLWIACLAPLVLGHSPQLSVHRARRRDARRVQPRDRQRHHGRRSVRGRAAAPPLRPRAVGAAAAAPTGCCTRSRPGARSASWSRTRPSGRRRRTA